MDTQSNIDDQEHLAGPQDHTLFYLQSNAAQALAQFTQSLQACLDCADIRRYYPLQLTLTLDAYVLVEESRGDKARIEHLLNIDPTIVAQLREIEVLHRMVYQLTHRLEACVDTFHFGLTSIGGMVFFTKENG